MFLCLYSFKFACFDNLMHDLIYSINPKNKMICVQRYEEVGKSLEILLHYVML